MITPGDAFNFLRLGWGAIRGVTRFLRRNRRVLAPQEKLALRSKWKPEFQDKIDELQHKGLRQDAIIRDMKRLDTYPEVSKGRGVSSWFRGGLVDTYEKGIMVGLSWEGLVQEESGWRYADYDSESKKAEYATLLLTGFIPYENIESVDWIGDDYYGFPHIYCYFAFGGEPYERLAFCRRLQVPGRETFVEVAGYKAVRALSKKRGIRR